MTINQIIIILFGCLYFLFIIYTRRKGNFAEFSVAGRSLGTFLIFASLSATYIGPSSTMGLTRNGFNNGYFLLLIAVFNGISIIIEGIYLSPKIRSKFADSFSIGDIIGGERSHNHKIIRIGIGIISFCMMASIGIALSYAGGELVNNVFGFPKRISIAIITTIVIIYSSFGGIRATIQTDVVQFLHFIVLIPILGLLMVFSTDFSMADYSAQTLAATSTAFEPTTALAILGMIFYWSLQNGFDAPAINRFLAAKDSNVTKRATIYTGVFSAFWLFLMVFLGSAGRYLHPEMADSDQILLEIAEIYFPGIIYGIFIIAMIGVVMSSHDSVLNSASVSFSEDVVAALKPNITDAQKVTYSKAVTVVVGLISIYVAGFLNSILDTIIFIISIYIPLVVPVLILSILKSKHYWQSALVSMLVGLFSYLIWNGMALDSFFPTILVSLFLNVFSYFITDRICARNTNKLTMNRIKRHTVE